MTLAEEVKQLAHNSADDVYSAGQVNTLEVEDALVAFAAEVCRKTVEAAARVCDAGQECTTSKECHRIDAKLIRSLLPQPTAQEPK